MKCNITFDGKSPAYCNTHKRNFGICFAICDVTTKEEARQCAIDYQKMASEKNLSYGEIINFQNSFSALAKKFHLVREFQENGII
jgi:hypothetical protein